MPHHAAKDRVEEALDASGLAWRVLQPCAYGTNLDAAVADAVATGRFASAWGLDTAQSLVDLGDVAEAAAVLLTEDGLDGGTFEAVGPEPLTAPRIADLLAGLVGRAITAVDVPPDGAVPPPRRVRRALPPADARPLPGARVHREPARARGAARTAHPHLRLPPGPPAPGAGDRLARRNGPTTVTCEEDAVDQILAQWGRERPDLDCTPMGIVGRITQLQREVYLAQRATFARHGLDAPSFDVLAALRRAGAPYQLTPTALMRSALVTSGAITQRLDRLEEKGLITRERSEADGRAVVVTLSPAGRAALDAALPDHLETERGLLEGLSNEDHEVLAGLLRRLLVALGRVPDRR